MIEEDLVTLARSPGGADLTTLRVPRGLGELLTERRARLGPDAAALVDDAAALAVPASPTLLAGAAFVPDTEHLADTAAAHPDLLDDDTFDWIAEAVFKEGSLRREAGLPVPQAVTPGLGRLTTCSTTSARTSRKGAPSPGYGIFRRRWPEEVCCLVTSVPTLRVHGARVNPPGSHKRTCVHRVHACGVPGYFFAADGGCLVEPCPHRRGGLDATGVRAGPDGPPPACRAKRTNERNEQVGPGPRTGRP
ncbi:hypothetical protein [Kitasatospora sp. NPDC059327]|uniref:hypothetical protein n=1 Tax=Kitasatospora sp. NPDC059327 TaxID=3346803 RepID=UPI0036C627EF